MFLTKYPAAKNRFLIMVDGNGILHYRGFGSASQLGVVMDIPTIGVGKELLVVDGMDADYIAQKCSLELKKFGDQVELVGPRTGKLYGQAVRSKSQHEPIYVSIGHMISLDSAVDLVLKCCRNSNLLPEPVRLADGLSRDVIKSNPGLTKYFDKNNKPIPFPASKPSPSPSPSPSSSSSSSHSSSTPSKTYSEKTSYTSGKYERDERAVRADSDRSKKADSEKGKAASEKGKAEPEKGKGKRGAFWACDCGANNPIGRDSCEFCYHSRKVPQEAGGNPVSFSGSEPALSGNSTQRRKKSWMCECGNEVVDSISCNQCRYINMSS